MPRKYGSLVFTTTTIVSGGPTEHSLTPEGSAVFETFVQPGGQSFSVAWSGNPTAKVIVPLPTVDKYHAELAAIEHDDDPTDGGRTLLRKVDDGNDTNPVYNHITDKFGLDDGVNSIMCSPGSAQGALLLEILAEYRDQVP